MSGRRLGLLAAVLVMVAAVVFSALRGREPSAAERAQSLSERIACPVCTGESVAASNASVSRAIRADIARRIDAGESDAEILDFYARRFPDKVLIPSDSGIGLIAWGVPVLAVVGGATALGFAVARWRRQPRLVATADDAALVERAREES